MMHPCTRANVHQNLPKPAGESSSLRRDHAGSKTRLRAGVYESLAVVAQAGAARQVEPRAVLVGYDGSAECSDVTRSSTHPQRTACLGAAAPWQVRLQCGDPTGVRVMASAAETWYVRLPDGRTLRARN